MRYIVEVYCTGLGWAKSKHGGDTLQEAQDAEHRLRADNNAWVNLAALKQTRIVKSEGVCTN